MGKHPLDEITEEDYMYFIHLYYANPSDAKDVLSFFILPRYKVLYSVQKKIFWLSQFHPEKVLKRANNL
jgi:imidazoleglycerol phosphate synthase glutamine amidotransferase subunit HisH